MSNTAWILFGMAFIWSTLVHISVQLSTIIDNLSAISNNTYKPIELDDDDFDPMDDWYRNK